MAVLEKIRVKMGVFITAIIGLALLSFIIDAETLNSAISMFSSKYDVGEMNGKSISYQDFQKKVEYYTQVQQLTSNSSVVDERTQEMINQSAWQDFLSEYVLIPQMEQAGIAVGEEEMFDMTQGTYISPVLAREQAFIGENGQFDRSRVVSFIKEIPNDNTGNLSMYWNFLKTNMKNEQLFSKYITMLSKSNVNNPVQVRRSIEDNNITSDVSFIIKPYGFAEDTTIKVTPQEVKEYYNKNRKNFEQTASRDIEYVVFSVTPSAEDVRLAEEDIQKSFEEFKGTANLKSFLARNSDKKLDTRFYKEGELSSISPVLDSFAFKATLADVLPVYREGDLFRAARVNQIKQLPDSVFVQHILLQNQDKAAAESLADSLMTLINKGADFGQLASEYSADKNPNALPGDIGWMTQNYMIPGFDTCFVATPGKAFTLSSNYGLHIVKVKERTAVHKKVQIAILEKSAVAGKQTYHDYYTKANELSAKAQDGYQSYLPAVKEMNLVSMPAYGVLPGAKNVATYPNAREISRWVYEAKKGDVSPIISVDNKHFFVVALTSVHEDGIPPIEEVSSQIASVLRREKSMDKMLASTKEEIAGLTTLDEMAAKLGTTVSKQSGIAFGAFGSQSFDPMFIGAVSGAKENVVTGPVKGSVGIYVFNVDARVTGAFYTEEDAKKRAAQMFSYQVQMLPSIMQKEAKVEDNRTKFF